MAAIQGLMGETRLLKAAIHFQEYGDLKSHLQAMRQAADAGVPDVDPAAEQDRLEDALAAAAEAAYAAAEDLQAAIRSESIWVYQANLGVALTLLTQIDPENSEYRQAALSALANCAEGREDHPAVVGLVAMRERLARAETSPGETPPSDAESDDGEEEQ